jgi:hypothetical protein
MLKKPFASEISRMKETVLALVLDRPLPLVPATCHLLPHHLLLPLGLLEELWQDEVRLDLELLERCSRRFVGVGPSCRTI